MNNRIEEEFSPEMDLGLKNVLSSFQLIFKSVSALANISSNPFQNINGRKLGIQYALPLEDFKCFDSYNEYPLQGFELKLVNGEIIHLYVGNLSNLGALYFESPDKSLSPKEYKRFILNFILAQLQAFSTIPRVSSSPELSLSVTNLGRNILGILSMDITSDISGESNDNFIYSAN